MRDINKVILLGRLGADPIRRVTKVGTAVVHFSVATKRRYLREGAGSSAEFTTPPLNAPNAESIVDLSLAPAGEAESNDSGVAAALSSAPYESFGSRNAVSASSPDPVKVEETQWHRIVSWGKLGDNCAQYLKKGNSVYVEEALRTHSYNDKAGAQKWSTEIVAETISFLDGAQR